MIERPRRRGLSTIIQAVRGERDSRSEAIEDRPNFARLASKVETTCLDERGVLILGAGDFSVKTARWE